MNKGSISSISSSILKIITVLLVCSFVALSIGSFSYAKARESDPGGEQTGHIFRVVSIFNQDIIWMWAPTSKIISLTTNFSSDSEQRYAFLKISDLYAIILKDGRALIMSQLYSSNEGRYALFYSYNRYSEIYNRYDLIDDPYLKEIELFVINRDNYFTRSDIKSVLLK
ncbi:MAG: hypothetical protein HQK49_22140 [Oligoflexia bacterium]|nr:hypothetical protein [Oligoflexia bacterium]